jgi:hypothetical protein
MLNAEEGLFITIEPLGTQVLLPAFVIGYETSLKDDQILRPLAGGPHWLIQLFQQAGGYCMRYPSVVGCILRFSANHGKGLADLSSLIRGFQLMAEDPKVGVLQRDYPVLRKLVCTHGQDYTREELASLESYLRSFLLVPPIESGMEALIHFQECDPLEYFLEWKMLSCRLRPAEHRRGSIYAVNEDFMYYAETLADFELSDEEEILSSQIQYLGRAGQKIGETGPPRVFLLWENSD